MSSHFPFRPSPSLPAIEQWVKMEDVEKKRLETSTWIPLHAHYVTVSLGHFGSAGYRKEYYSIDSIIVPQVQKEELQDKDWKSVARHHPDSASTDLENFTPGGCFEGVEAIRYSVLAQGFDTGEPPEWDLFQEIKIALQLLRRGDVWIRPEEDDVVVAVLERDREGIPSCLLMKAEFLRDYLCARKASLLITGFAYRDAVEEEFPTLDLPESGEQKRIFGHGQWDCEMDPIHEGGRPFGQKVSIIRMWRESVDPADDVPVMPHPTEEPSARSEQYTKTDNSRKLFNVTGRIWFKHWIEPAEKSPRIRGDHSPSRLHFIVDNQEQKTLAGDALSNHRGWLWFKPSVIKTLLDRPKTKFEWWTKSTGEIGPSEMHKLHFGINSIGLINVLAYKMGDLPEWAQKLWVAHNVGPEGGLSEELHKAQNLAIAPETYAPETSLWHNLNALQNLTEEAYGISLFSKLPSSNDFFRSVHRFYGDSFEQVCQLCKELHRAISERIDIGAINSKIDPEQAQMANDKKLRQIKRVQIWLDKLGFDGRTLTRSLGGLADLRQGDAHAQGKDLRESLELLDLPEDSTNYSELCFHIILKTANCLADIRRSVHSKISHL